MEVHSRAHDSQTNLRNAVVRAMAAGVHVVVAVPMVAVTPVDALPRRKHTRQGVRVETHGSGRGLKTHGSGRELE